MLSFCRPVSRLFSVLLIACLPLFSCVQAQSLQAPEFSSEQASLSVTPLVDGLKITWGMDFIDDRQLLFTQRSGKLGLLNLQTKSITWLSGLPEVYAQRQGGLLDVKVAESFAYTGLVYLTYSKPVAASSVTTLARAKLQGDKLVDWQDLLITDSSSATSIHYGSRIAFDGKGHVFFSVGDRGQRHQAQNLSNHQGTIIRLHLDGSVPEDNPFVNRPDALPEIWSYGHRNPQGLFFDKTTNQLWEIEHGPTWWR
ncbi:PQQ-dependent sugar dehydrogenase [Thiomicrorhabdus marina]|uniref:PQQ-dependent sugar dehydrogenase n=1 Tax=Thiomicrorhabdus marina TaxID=2818442 RepID=UPI001FB80EB6|nr:PQQ-dependent sugar dehydrogenase [Thiomicrorhabdus marina]